MRYTHNLHIIRKKKHRNTISLAMTVLLILLVLVLGFTLLDAKQFFGGFVESLTRVMIAYGVSLVFAVTVGLLVTTSETIENLTVPILDALQSFPSFALYPLFVVWFGKTAIVTIFILIIEMIWPILFTILSGQKQIREENIEAAQIFGARGPKYIWYFLFPMLLPAIVTGSIVAWGEAWEAIIAAEIIVNVPGVGSYLAGVGQHNQSSILIIGIILLLTILFILNKYIWLPLLNLSTKYLQE